MSNNLRIAVIGGDGIGPEVTAQALAVLRKVIPDMTATSFDLGARRYLQTGEILTDDDLAALQDFDAILFGAIGDPAVPPGILERGFLLKLRFSFDYHVNLRPIKLYQGVTSPLRNPGEIDFVVVREGTEGPYAGVGGTIREGTAHEVATEVSTNTRYGIERVVKDAFARAQQRRKHVTWVHKTNVLQFAGSLWQRTVDEVAAQFPEVTVDYQHIDAATIYMTTDPGRYDVIVTDNLFGDIITDLAGAVSGGIGYAASGSIDTSGRHPSLFEPIHGSAPDIAGTNTANPLAAILSAALLLHQVGYDEEAAKIENAVQQYLAHRDSKGFSDHSTTGIGHSIIDAL